MQFWSEIKYLNYNSEIVAIQVQPKPCATSRGKVPELKSLIDQIHRTLIDIWSDPFYFFYENRVSINFYYNDKLYLSIGSKGNNRTPKLNRSFFIEDFKHVGGKKDFNRQAFGKILFKTRKLLAHFFPIEFPSETIEKPQFIRETPQKNMDLYDRRTFLYTNSYSFMKEVKNPISVRKPIVYHHNGRK